MLRKLGTLVFLGVTVLATTGLSGCIIDNDSDPPVDNCSQYRYIHFNFAIVRNGEYTTCAQAGASSVRFYLGESGNYYEEACAIGIPDEGQTVYTDPVPVAGAYNYYLELWGTGPLSQTDTGSVVVQACTPTPLNPYHIDFEVL